MSEKLRKFLVMAAGVLVILETTVISGCRANISGTESDRMVEYTVICGDEIPEEFKKQINENKAKAMKLTYKDDEYLYIAEGFGTKETGGYSITVNTIYEIFTQTQQAFHSIPSLLLYTDNSPDC